MSLSTDHSAGLIFLTLALWLLASCATLDMPTPVKKVKTTNVMAPSFEYRPPPQKREGAQGAESRRAEATSHSAVEPCNEGGSGPGTPAASAEPPFRSEGAPKTIESLDATEAHSPPASTEGSEDDDVPASNAE